MFDVSIYDKAERIIHERRQNAETVHIMRTAEIEKKIPEITELNRELSTISMKLLEIIQSNENVETKISRVERDNRQAQSIIRSYLKRYGYPENYLEISYICNKCSDTGYSGGKRCTCFKDIVRKLSVEKLNKSAQVNLLNFDTFRLSYYGKLEDSMRPVYDYCIEYTKTFRPSSSRNILMYGNTGLGKTHLSLAIANDIIKKGYSVAYDSVINYLRKIEDEHFGRSSPETNTLELILDADLLIMDDLGSEYESKFYVATIYNIINTRLNRSLPVIISTNLSLNEIDTRYDMRITSRLGTVYDYLKFVGTDIRYLKKNNREL